YKLAYESKFFRGHSEILRKQPESSFENLIGLYDSLELKTLPETPNGSSSSQHKAHNQQHGPWSLYNLLTFQTSSLACLLLFY
ncbi:hypothetical protein STEG23_013072, partial [Scotinomys teguina]